MYVKNNKGMMTVEACVIIPLIIFISLILIWIGILMYNKSAINCALVNALDAGARCAEDDNDTICRIVKEKAEFMLDEKLLLAEDPELTVTVDHGSITADLQASMQAPPVPLINDLVSNRYWDMGARKSINRIRASRTVRTMKRMNEFVSEAGRAAAEAGMGEEGE